MIRKEKSIFNLIEIFRKGTKKVLFAINEKLYCERSNLHDYYCATDEMVRR